eukprot:g29350.t1
MDGAEAALVRGAAEASILRVALGAAALLRDFGRENIAAGESIASATRRKLLREAAKGALQNSSAAAQDTSEMASFLFLVHVLATELLQSEASFMRKAGKLDRLDEEEIKVAGWPWQSVDVEYVEFAGEQNGSSTPAFAKAEVFRCVGLCSSWSFQPLRVPGVRWRSSLFSPCSFIPPSF